MLRAPGHGPARRAARTPSTSARTDTREAARVRPPADRSRPALPPPAPGSWSYPPAGNGRQRASELGGQSRERLPQRRRTPDDYQLHPGRRRLAAGPVGLAQPPASAIALHGVLELSAHGESCASRLGRLAPQDDDGGPVDTSASLEKRLKVGAAGQPLASGKATRYTVSRLRPLARRRLSTFRPPFVDIRSRKPCVFARRRRLGWNVRFMNALPFPIVEPPQCRHAVMRSQPTKPLRRLPTVC